LLLRRELLYFGQSLLKKVCHMLILCDNGW
jgi:hypothetical protein